MSAAEVALTVDPASVEKFNVRNPMKGPRIVAAVLAGREISHQHRRVCVCDRTTARPQRDTMSMLKPSVRLSAVIATLSVSVVLLAAIDGASAKSSSNGNGGSRQPQIVNTIHPIISKPKNSDRDHDRKKADRDHDRCRKSGKCSVPPVRTILQ
jgi:hypothetical protein